MIAQLAPILLGCCLALLLMALLLSLLQLKRAAQGRWSWLPRATLAGAALCLALILALSYGELGRPPLRTLGETRLWYALLLLVTGLVIEMYWQTTVLRLPMLGFGVLFTALCLAHPETFDAHLMPALRSYWFVPHVVVYLFAYAALGLAAGAGAVAYWQERGAHPQAAQPARLAEILLGLGVLGLSCGLVFGALWAKEAWGHYWSWDPKETWAFLTWACYVSLLHVYQRWPLRYRSLALTLAFLVVLGCWFLVHVLPAAQQSVHTYAIPN